MRIFLLTVVFAATVFAQDLGNLFFEGNCIACHEREEARSAPSIQQVTKVYKKKYRNKEEFVTQMTQWLLAPEKATALMPKAVQKYGLMPKIAYDSYTLKQIASYLYETY